MLTSHIIYSTDSSPDESTPLLGSGSSTDIARRSPLREFLAAVGPLDVAEFKEARIIMKVYMVFRVSVLRCIIEESVGKRLVFFVAYRVGCVDIYLLFNLIL